MLGFFEVVCRFLQAYVSICAIDRLARENEPKQHQIHYFSDFSTRRIYGTWCICFIFHLHHIYDQDLCKSIIHVTVAATAQWWYDRGKPICAHLKRKWSSVILKRGGGGEREIFNDENVLTQQNSWKKTILLFAQNSQSWVDCKKYGKIKKFATMADISFFFCSAVSADFFSVAVITLVQVDHHFFYVLRSLNG